MRPSAWRGRHRWPGAPERVAVWASYHRRLLRVPSQKVGQLLALGLSKGQRLEVHNYSPPTSGR